MTIPGLRTSDVTVGGIVHFGRMLDKIRLAAAGALPGGYFLGDEDFTWWDGRCCRFLRVDYRDLADLVRSGAGDDEALEWCFQRGRRPDAEEIQIWNAFILKRGWRDESTPGLEADKRAAGFGGREDLVTWVDLSRAEES